MPDLPKTGFFRLSQILGDKKADPPIPALIPVGRSTWWEGVKSGRYPQPVRFLGPRITAWRVEDILSLIEGDWVNENTDLKGKNLERCRKSLSAGIRNGTN